MTPLETPSSGEPEARATSPRRSGVVVPRPLKWHGRLAAALIYGAIRCVAATLRYHWRNETGMFQPGEPLQPVIFAIWHNRLALSLVVYVRYAQRIDPRRKLAALVSASGDGGLLARVLEHFGVQPVRGSSSRRGPQALRELTSSARRGFDLAITPDGPRGPCYVVNEGVIAAAQLTGLKIIPVSYQLGWRFQLKSWDRFQIPLPFSRCDVVYGAPLVVPREITPERREQLRGELEGKLIALAKD